MHRPNVCFLLSLLFLPCLSLAKACLGFTSTIQNFYTLVLRPAGLAALIPSPAPVPFVVQHDALIGSGMRAQMSMRRPVFLPPPHCVAMQIPGLRCTQGWNPRLWLWSLHVACGHRGGETGGQEEAEQVGVFLVPVPQTHFLAKCLLPSLPLQLRPLLLLRETRSPEQGWGGPHARWIKSEGQVHVCLREGDGEWRGRQGAQEENSSFSGGFS